MKVSAILAALQSDGWYLVASSTLCMQRVSAMNKVVESANELDNRISPRFTILCDMDGTLVDTDYANFLSYRRAIEEVTRGKHDVQFNSRDRLSREGLKEKIPCLTDAEYERIISLKTECFSGFLSETRLNIALADSIRKFSQKNEIVLVTSCREKRAVETLRHHNFLGCFARLICREALSESGLSNKYEKALALLGVNPAAVFVYENGAADIEKAMLAGVPKGNIISVGFLTGECVVLV